MASSPSRILLCGHRSFAAKGLSEVLQAQGHQVTNFSRGPVRAEGATVTGPVDKVHENPHLPGPYDTVINFILLKDEAIPANEAYLQSLLDFSRQKGVRNFIHISSISSYAASAKRVTEDSPVETNPAKKGAYGGLKVASDQYLARHCPPEIRLIWVRPGFVLAEGLVNPIVGMAFKTPWNKLLLIGDKGNQQPCIDRRRLHEAIAKIAANPPRESGRNYLTIDTASPSRKEWLAWCCQTLGCGTGVATLPPWLWMTMALGGEVVARAAGMKLRPYRVIGNACRSQWFDSARTQRELGVDFTTDWKGLIASAFEGQEKNFQMPYPPAPAPTPGSLGINKVAFIGYGGIVKQKHLPALKALGFAGSIAAYDIEARTDAETGQAIQKVAATPLEPADLIVVASPGRAHGQAIPLLEKAPAPVLIEKPLCYKPQELEEWLQVARSRQAGTYICHNYRFKENVTGMLDHLRQINPGKLYQVDLIFQSLPVSEHFPAWRRDERRAQTLLIEYSLHFLDVACMFSSQPWAVKDLRWELNKYGQTCLIQGTIACEAYSINFLLRQGFIPRKARILFTFRNYQTSLSFFPDTFVPHHAGDGAGLHGLEKKAAAKATRRKIIDKFTSRDSDQSHPLTYLAARQGGALGESVSVLRLENFYKMLFEISGAVYGE